MTGKRHEYKAAFYQVDMQMNQNMTFENLLEKQMASPERLFEIDHDNYVLQKLEKNKVTGFWYGMLIKARMNDIPAKINLESLESSDLGIDDNEGLAEACAFLYVPAMNVIIVQKSQYAPYITMLSPILEKTSGCMPCAFREILTKNAWEKLIKKKGIYKIIFKIAGVRPGYLADNRYAATLINGVTQFACSELELSMAAPRGGILQNIVDFVKTILGNAELKKLIVYGQDETTGQTSPLDLLKDKIEYSEKRTIEARTMTYEERRSILWNAYLAKKEELHEMFAE